MKNSTRRFNRVLHTNTSTNLYLLESRRFGDLRADQTLPSENHIDSKSTPEVYPLKVNPIQIIIQSSAIVQHENKKTISLLAHRLVRRK